MALDHDFALDALTQAADLFAAQVVDEVAAAADRDAVPWSTEPLTATVMTSIPGTEGR